VGLLALTAAGLGVVALAGRALLHGEQDPLLVGVGLLLAESVAGGVRDVLRLPGAPTWLGLAALGQSVLGAIAGLLAVIRRPKVPPRERLLAVLGPGRRAVLVAAIVALGLAALYPRLLTPEVGALEPMVVVLGPGGGLPSLVAAVAIVLVAPVAARATPGAGLLAVAAVAAVTLARVALHATDLGAPQVAPSPWLWLEIVAAVALLGLVASVDRGVDTAARR
jgi:hypothetical protein